MKHQTRAHPDVRLTGVLSGLGIAASSRYHAGVPAGERKRPGPKGKPIPWWTEQTIVTMAAANPWYGYKRIAVMCRRAGHGVTNCHCYHVMKQHDLLQKRWPRAAEIYQAAKLWQMNVTYIHIPGYGWWYAVTVIDYCSRYLLAAYLTDSYSASSVTTTLAEAKREAERLHGPLTRTPFLETDNGVSFVVRKFSRFVKDQFVHVRIAYRTPTQLGLLERFHRTRKQEEVCWRLYDHPGHARACLAEFRDRYNRQRRHWALIPEDGGDPLTPEYGCVTGLAVQIPRWQGWATKAEEQLDQIILKDAA